MASTATEKDVPAVSPSLAAELDPEPGAMPAATAGPVGPLSSPAVAVDNVDDASDLVVVSSGSGFLFLGWDSNGWNEN